MTTTNVKLNTRIFKPEVERCPICGAKLIYRYTVSNKVIQFFDGEKYRVKNLGYSCSNVDCKTTGIIYTSQTATKSCVKGYTYSAKILGTILYYKSLKVSRIAIETRLANRGIEISDRNIDMIYDKYKERLSSDHKKSIEIEYGYMLKQFDQILLSIDIFNVAKNVWLLSIRNFMTNSQIGLHFIHNNDYSVLDDYLNKDLNITKIATVKKQTRIYKEILKRVNKEVCFIHYVNY